jgi:hypothetical protein
MKILLVTDAWKPQVNGVVTTLENLVKKLIFVFLPHKLSLISKKNAGYSSSIYK